MPLPTNRNIVFARHIEATINLKGGLVPGKSDRSYPATEKGLGQSVVLGAFLTAELPEEFTVVTSGYLRTQQSAINGGLAIDLVEPAFNEFNWGDFMNDAPAEVRADFDRRYPTDISVRAPNGESTLDLYNRVRQGLTTVLDTYPGTVVIIAHGRSILAARMVLQNIPPTDTGWSEMYRNGNAELGNADILAYSIPKLGGHGTYRICPAPYKPLMECPEHSF